MPDNTDNFTQPTAPTDPGVDICLTCGRELRPHCPQCGSYRNYALVKQRDVVTRDDGKRVILSVYRCVRCAITFNDDDWRFKCQAPPERKARDGQHSSSGKRDVVWNPKVAPFEPSAAEKEMAKLRKKWGIE